MTISRRTERTSRRSCLRRSLQRSRTSSASDLARAASRDDGLLESSTARRADGAGRATRLRVLAGANSYRWRSSATPSVGRACLDEHAEQDVPVEAVLPAAPRPGDVGSLRKRRRRPPSHRRVPSRLGDEVLPHPAVRAGCRRLASERHDHEALSRRPGRRRPSCAGAASADDTAAKVTLVYEHGPCRTSPARASGACWWNTRPAAPRRRTPIRQLRLHLCHRAGRGDPQPGQ